MAKIGVGIVGSGGGLRGCSQVGNLRALVPWILKKEAELCYLGGTSVGALNLSKLAEARITQDLPRCLEELNRVWMAIEEAGPESVFPHLSMWDYIMGGFKKDALLDGSTLWKLVRGGRPLDAQGIIRSDIQFDVFAYNEETWLQEVFSNTQEPVKNNPEIMPSAIVASASIAPFFPSVLINGVPYSDGMHISLTRAIKAGCDIIFVLLPYRKAGKEIRPPGFIPRLFPFIARSAEAYSAAMRKLDNEELERAEEIATNVRALSELQKKVSSRFWRLSKKKQIDNDFLEARFTFQTKRAVRIIPIHIGHQPDTFFINTFKKGDISRLVEDSADTMNRILSDLDREI